MSNARKRFPRQGQAATDVLAALETIRDKDVDWREGKAFSLVFHAGEDVADLLRGAAEKFMFENGLNPTAFPSLKQLESEVLAMSADMLGGDENVVGNMTCGGTESIMMAVKAARQWAQNEKRPRANRPEMVLPTSAHPAFPKAGHYFGVKPVWVPVRDDFQADVKAMERAVTSRTALIVGSAPSYPQGVVDPISDIAKVAQKKGILCHVDACVGGYMLPFVRALGRKVPDFDFSVPGVTSMSLDLHKYGYSAKGASVVLYRNPSLRRHQYYAFTDWPGGIYVSPTMTGTRPGGPIAASWAVLRYLGFEGYTKIAGEVMEAVDALREGIDQIPGLYIQGDPHMSVMAIGSDTLSVYEIGDNMTDRGWHLDRQQNPASLHLTINRAHVGGVENFLEALRESARVEPKSQRDRWVEKARGVAMKAAVKVLPKVVVTKATELASAAMGLDGDDVPERTAAMYGLIGSMPNRGDLETMVIGLLDKITRYDPTREIAVGETKPAPGR